MIAVVAAGRLRTVEEEGGGSAELVLVSTTTTSDTAGNSTTFTPTLPTNFEAGDACIVIVAADLNRDLSTSSTGWTMLDHIKQSGGATSSGIFVLENAQAGANPLVITASGSERFCSIAYRFSGGAGDYDISATGAQGSSSTSSPPNHTPPNGEQEYIWIAARAGDAQVQASAAPSGYGNLVTTGGTSSDGCVVAAAHKTETSSSDDPGTFTAASEQWVCWTIAVALN